MIIKKHIFILVLFCGIFFAVVMPMQKAYAITIIPPRVELAANPGQTITNVVKIYNETEETLTLYTSTANFTAKQGKEGVPEFLSPEESDYGLAKWINMQKGPIIVLPKEYIVLEYSIAIPFGADPGGHYAGIFFGGQNPEDVNKNSSVGVSSKAGMLVLLAVSGNVVEKGKLTEFGLRDNKKFLERLPVSFTIGFENEGNVHLRPEGEIYISNIFGKIVDAVDVNKRKIGTGANVLPKTTRHFEETWKKNADSPVQENEGFFEKVKKEKENFALGKYTARLNLKYGNTGKNINEFVSFWIFPWRFILVCLISGIVILVMLRLAIKKYNNWIISKALSKK